MNGKPKIILTDLPTGGIYRKFNLVVPSRDGRSMDMDMRRLSLWAFGTTYTVSTCFNRFCHKEYPRLIID